MSRSIRLVPEAARSLAFGSIGAAYMGVGTAFTKPIRILMIQNLTDASLMFSFDGIVDHVPLPQDGFILLDVTTNKAKEDGLYFAEGTRIYVKEIATPTTGAVYVTTFYGYSD
jgi:hypothetical protein